MLEVEKDFFENCRKTYKSTGKIFFLIKDWSPKNVKRMDERDYLIKLSFHIIRAGKEQFLVNRHRKGNERPDKGVEIPISIAPYVGKCMIEQTSNNAYKKGQCDIKNVQNFSGYTFELIRGFPTLTKGAINFKLMHNSKETKYFLNRQIGITEIGNQAGVEIPKEMLEQIGRYLIECTKIIKKS
jgi:hypothetical protein